MPLDLYWLIHHNISPSFKNLTCVLIIILVLSLGFIISIMFYMPNIAIILTDKQVKGFVFINLDERFNPIEKIILL